LAVNTKYLFFQIMLFFWTFYSKNSPKTNPKKM